MSFPTKEVFSPNPNRARWDSRRQRSHANGNEEAKERELPKSIEAEEHLLASCMLDGPDVVSRCIDEGVAVESFYETKHGILFERLVDLFRRGLTCEMSMVAEELKLHQQLEAVGGYAFLMQVTAKIPTTAQAGYFIATVKRLALERKRIRAAVSLVESGYGGDADAVRRRCAELRELESEESAFLPAVLSAVALAEKKIPKPEELVASVLHRGRRMIVAGGSKSFKTWVLLDFAISVASGTPWWGMATAKGPVLYVNFELPIWGLDERIGEICKAKSGMARPETLHLWNLDGYAADIDELLPYFEARGIRGQYALIILDPIYVCLGQRDENSNSDVTQLMNRLAKLARVTGAAVAFGHHFSKGNQGEKDVRDRASGAGAWVRAPDTVLTLTAHEEEEAFCVDYVLRNMKKKEPVVVRWKHPTMEVAAGLNPAALKGPGRTKEFGVAELCELLEGGPLTFSEWEKAAGVGKKNKMSNSTFKRLRTEAVEGGRVTQNGPIYSLAGAEKK